MKEGVSTVLIITVIGLAITNSIIIYKLNNISTQLQPLENTFNDISEILKKVKQIIP